MNWSISDLQNLHQFDLIVLESIIFWLIRSPDFVKINGFWKYFIDFFKNWILLTFYPIKYNLTLAIWRSLKINKFIWKKMTALCWIEFENVYGNKWAFWKAFFTLTFSSTGGNPILKQISLKKDLISLELHNNAFPQINHINIIV